MASAPFRQPEPLPDISIYPVGGRHRMPSFAHERARLIIMQILIRLFAPAGMVASELALMWDPDNLRTHLLPDTMVALGVGELDPIYGVLRNQYRIWHEGKPPDLVIELASRTTVGRDNLGKKEDYAALGVPEYVQFDPLRKYLRSGLRVYQLRGGVYRPVHAQPQGAASSAVLSGYEWLQQDIYLRLRDRATGLLVPTPDEARAAAEARALIAEEEVARLRAEIARLHGDTTG
jgi:Uma2 family endonuclease